MYGLRKPSRRFSLLLLEEGEYYVRDYVAECTWPEHISGNWQGISKLSGQLRLCTHSIFFEANDVRVPIVRLPFLSMAGLEGKSHSSLLISTHHLVKMKANAADTPYIFERNAPSDWAFILPYTPLHDFMPLAQQMLIASRMQPHDREVTLLNILRTLEEEHTFDPGHLKNPGIETICVDSSVFASSPLVRECGRLAVTNQRVYFQPLHNIGGDVPCLSHPLSAIAAVARRRSSLRNVGLEIFFTQSNVSGVSQDAPSLFFSFKSVEERDCALSKLLSRDLLGSSLPGGRATALAACSILEADVCWLRKVTKAWQYGRVSNFEYLLYCNLAAGRSFNDLTQYPVFPWILQDYTSGTLDLNVTSVFRDLSKPVGALESKRLEAYRQRYKSMPEDSSEPPFLYGTHYSCPGYCLFWLVRAAPGHMLRLQNGKFDSPDRLFYSIAESWESVLSNPADVKELIPEFYVPRSHEFLSNKAFLPLGVRQNGKNVHDVELPPWADSAAHFLAIQQAALEAPFVSANLHHWIDLIFGYKQRGKAAEKADNVFRFLTYEGAIDVEAVVDAEERAALEMQINEFGQCPRQLFLQPHPKRLVCPPVQPPNDSMNVKTDALSLALVSAVMAATSQKKEEDYIETEDEALLLELDVLKDVDCSIEEGEEGADALANMKPNETVQLTTSTSLFRKLKSAVSNPSPEGKKLLASLFTWPESLEQQDQPRKAGFANKLSNHLQSFTGSQSEICKNQAQERTEGTVRKAEGQSYNAAVAHSIVSTWGQALSKSKLQVGHILRAGMESVNALRITRVGIRTVLYTASHDGNVRVFDIATGEQLRAKKLGGGQPLTSLALLPHNDNCSKHPLVLAGSFDGRVYQYSVETGRVCGSIVCHQDSVSCIEILSPEALLTASWDGSICIWDLSNDQELWSESGDAFMSPKHSIKGLPGGIWAVSVRSNSVYMGFEDGIAACWDIGALSLRWQVSLSDDYIGGMSCVPQEEMIIVATADGHLVLVATETGATVAQVACGGPVRCCITDGESVLAGREDGSIALWDLVQQRRQLSKTSVSDVDAGPYSQVLFNIEEGSAINDLGACLREGSLWLATAHESGKVCCWYAEVQ